MISNRFTRTLTGALLAAAALAFTTSAQADPNWLPKFNSSRHVYVSPDVGGDLRSKVDSPTFASDIKSLADQQNLNVYVVVTTSSGGDVSGSGPALVRQLWGMWSNHGLPSQRALVILMTGAPGANISSVGVRPGESLNAMGINRDMMNDVNGPVRTAIATYLRDSYNPSALPPAIVRNINAIVAARTASTQAPITSIDTTPPVSNPGLTSTSGPTTTNSGESMSIIVPIGIGLAIAIALVLIIRRRSPAPSTSSGSFEERLRSSTSSPRQTGYGNVPPASNASVTPTSTGSNTVHDATLLGAGAVGGYLLGSELERRREEERRRDSGSTTGSDN